MFPRRVRHDNVGGGDGTPPSSEERRSLSTATSVLLLSAHHSAHVLLYKIKKNKKICLWLVYRLVTALLLSTHHAAYVLVTKNSPAAVRLSLVLASIFNYIYMRAGVDVVTSLQLSADHSAHVLDIKISWGLVYKL